MATMTTRRFPSFQSELEELVGEHVKFEDEPLVLAIYYQPERDPQDVFLFEVIEGFGGESVDVDHELFEVTYRSSSGFDLAPGQSLHLVLTNPTEYQRAAEEHWPALDELRAAVTAEHFFVLHVDPSHQALRELIGA
jgi:hypothetical protein